MERNNVKVWERKRMERDNGNGKKEVRVWERKRMERDNGNGKKEREWERMILQRKRVRKNDNIKNGNEKES